MARPFVEFVQSQWLSWQSGVLPEPRADLAVKTLSRDPVDGSASLLVRYPPGWRAAGLEILGVDEEFFVLRGDLRRGRVTYGLHDYAFLPAGHRADVHAGPEGATVVTFLSALPRAAATLGGTAAFDPARQIERIATLQMAWDRANIDPNIGHLHPARKNLRLDPDGRGRTYLLGGMPQGFPASGSEPLERHPHFEEMFMIYGDMPCSRGIMRAGAYFWRPPGIWHGADCTVSGFLMLMRTPGTNVTVSEWCSKPHPVLLAPTFDPVLPPEVSRASVGPLSDPIDY